MNEKQDQGQNAGERQHPREKFRFWPYHELDGSTTMFQWKAEKEGPSDERRGGHEEGRNTRRECCSERRGRERVLRSFIHSSNY